MSLGPERQFPGELERDDPKGANEAEVTGSGPTVPSYARGAATGLTLSGSTTQWDGTDLTWSVVPEGEQPGTPFVDHCPPSPPPEFRIGATAEAPALTPAGEPGRLGVPGAQELADDLNPVRHVCSPALTAGTATVLGEIYQQKVEGNHEAAERKYEALFAERSAAPADRHKVRDMLGVAAGAMALGFDGEPAIDVAMHVFEEVGSRALPSAGLKESLEIAADAGRLGLRELSERAIAQAAEIARSAFLEVRAAFDPCEASSDDLLVYLNSLAQWMLLDDAGDGYAEEAADYVERVTTRLRTGNDGKCTPRVAAHGIGHG